jgi:AAA ATPase containing von Willebrand factor type A (vWA) domain
MGYDPTVKRILVRSSLSENPDKDVQMAVSEDLSADANDEGNRDVEIQMAINEDSSSDIPDDENQNADVEGSDTDVEENQDSDTDVQDSDADAEGNQDKGVHSGTRKRIQYEYSVGARTFITTKSPLFDFKADCAEGSSTRVWRVHDKYDEGNPRKEFALKDVWMVSDVPSEGELLDTIRNQLTVADRQYFLTTEVHAVVKIDETLDTTHSAIMRGAPTIVDHWIVKRKAGSAASIKPQVFGSSRLYSVGHTPSVGQQAPAAKHQFTPRTHYRIVWKEVCTPLHDQQTLDGAYALLREATEGKLHHNPIFNINRLFA